MADKEQGQEVELMAATQGNLEVLERAQIDVQISTAHRFPRSMQTFKTRATEMVTLDEATALSCIFRRPVGKKYNQKTGKSEVEYAEGKSIRMAEIVGACYGNLRVGSTLVEVTERYVKARGFAHDLESNFAAASEVVESTVKADGTPFSERMRFVVAKAALSKARRDATFQVVPGALCKTLETAARETAIGTEATLGKRRANAMEWINKVGVEKDRVFAALGINGPDDIGLEVLETLSGLRTAIHDGDTTPDEAFPVLATPEHPSAGKFGDEKPKGPTIKERSSSKSAPKATPAPEPPGEDPVESDRKAGVEELQAIRGDKARKAKWDAALLECGLPPMSDAEIAELDADRVKELLQVVRA